MGEPSDAPIRRHLTRRQWLGLGLAGAGALAWGLRPDADRPQIRRVPLAVERWDIGPRRIAFLADLHINQVIDRDRAYAAVELVRQESPDLILLGGDYLDRSPWWRLRFVEQFLVRLQEVGVPMAAVLGNHDYAGQDVYRLVASFQRLGIPLLVNQSLDVAGVRVLGMDDALYGEPSVPKGAYDRNTLALLHEPDFVDLVPSGPSAVLSGHTHGGQICLPFGIAPLLPPGGRRYVKGLYRVANRPLYVTAGVGMTGIAARVQCPAEVTIFDVRAA